MRKLPSLLDETNTVAKVQAAVAGNSDSSTDTTETACIWTVDKESMCPACGKPMLRVTAAGVPAYLCPDDRIVLPIRQTDFTALIK